MDIKQSGTATRPAAMVNRAREAPSPVCVAAAEAPRPRLRRSQLRRLACLLAIGAGFVVVGRAQAREVAGLESADIRPGTIVISTSQRRLTLMGYDGPQVSYPVAVGKPGKQWYGWARVDGKYVEPAWAPPAEVKRDNPRLPDVIAGGSPRNPMGMRALTLDREEIAIHGTNRPDSIGTYASYGCIRMLNRDIVDLYDRVRVGTPVLMVR